MLGSATPQSSSPLLKPGLQFSKCLFNSHPALLEQILEWCGKQLDMDLFSESLRKKYHNYPVCYLNSTPEWSRLKAAILRFTRVLSDRNVFT